MGFLLTTLGGILGLVAFVCFIMVLIKMFQQGQSTLGIVCIVLFFCGGIGYLIAMAFGWINSTKWGIRNTMLVWTGSFLGAILFQALSYAMTSSPG